MQDRLPSANAKYKISLEIVMDSSHTPSENGGRTNGKSLENEISIERIEALVTPEQVRSANVARRRRTFTKKRGELGQRVREQTPLRDVAADDEKATTDEEMQVRPKTPERKRRMRNRCESRRIASLKVSKSEADITDNETDGAQIRRQAKRASLVDIAQAEVLAFFSKTKKSISVVTSKGKERLRKKETLKRSKSAPHAFTQEELIESFRRAQLLSAGDGSFVERIYSISDAPQEPKPFRTEVQESVRLRKQQKIYSHKVVEIITPPTMDVVTQKMALQHRRYETENINILQLIKVLSTFTIRELITNYKSFKLDMKEECRRIKLLRNRCFMKLFLIMIFCGLGGFLFKFIEGSFENFYKCGVKRVKRDFIDLLWTKSHNLREDDWKSLARNRLRVFEEELHAAHEAGMKTYSGQRSWSFLNAVVYSLSIITTIGYGHIYPETRTGKALTIVYAIFGIPLFLLALTDFGKLFTRCIKFLWSYVRRLYYTGSCRKVRKTAQVQEIFKGAQMMYEIATFRRPSMVPDAENPDTLGTHMQGEIDTPTTPAISNFEIDDEFNLPITLAIVILLLYIFLGGFIYCVWEGWHFFDSFYFVFISMSTVGFGDMVPDDAVVMIVSIVYLVFGLALMSMCINVVQVKLSDTFKQASSKIGATMGISVAEEDGSFTIMPTENVEMPKIHEMPGITLQSQQQTPSSEKSINGTIFG